MTAAIQPVLAYFMALQDELCAALEALDGSAAFTCEELLPPTGGLARPRVLADGPNIEKAAVQFTHGIGQALPPAATARNPQFAGCGFEAASISVIVHPRNPYAPTTHMNLRFFLIDSEEGLRTAGPVQRNDPVWYFGGGFDLTPYYGFEEDCTHWHRIARHAAGDHYESFKAACDEYFYLPHRKEGRGIGGLFFDDWTEGGFEASLGLVKAIGNAFLPAYRPIFERRGAHALRRPGARLAAVPARTLRRVQSSHRPGDTLWPAERTARGIGLGIAAAAGGLALRLCGRRRV